MATAFKQVAVASKCLAIVMEKTVDNDPTKRKNAKDVNASTMRDNGYKIFQEFQEENRVSYWNPALVESVNSVDYVGFVRPGTLFVTGAELHLECLRGAWARRVLKSPSGFTIKSLGDVGGIEMQEVPQTQFIPLPEVLCLIVSSLNRVGQPATMTSIIETLQDEYAGMSIPKEEILYSTLGGLMSEAKLFCMGDHYFVPTPSMIQQYHQALFMRRPPMMWNQDEALAMYHRQQFISKQQEVCSRECQTGASIANGIPPYKPPAAVGKKDQASSAKLQRDANANGTKSSNVRKSTKGENLKSEKQPGFLARLFGRPQSKNREEKDVIQKAENTSPTSQQSGSSNGLQNPQPLATFSAQFPPPEWLYDPRYFKASSKTAAAAQHQQHLFAKIRKSSKDANGNRALKDDWNNVWLDLDPRGFKRDPTDNRFVSQRHVTCPENLVKGGGQWSPKHERIRPRQKNRLSKYLSSSSECVNYLGSTKPSADPDDHHHYKEPKKHHRSKHPTKLVLPNNEMTNLGKFPTTEPCTTINEVPRYESKRKSAPQTPITQGPISVPIVITTSLHRDTLPDYAAKTSTPAVSPISCKSRNRTPFREVVENCQDVENSEMLNMANENRDSAISSTSPVVTEMSSSDAKYSSWSGSDGHQDLPIPDNFIKPTGQFDHTYINVENGKNVDHTYVNENHANVDHTYENLSKVVLDEQQSFDSTQFENVSIDEENIFISKKEKIILPVDDCTVNNNNNNIVDNLQETNCIKIRPTYISTV